MIQNVLNRRAVMLLAGTALLAGCQVIPKAPPESTGPDVNAGTGLPEDQARHRVALLVPLAGPNGAVGQAIANAATMAVMDTNAKNLRITTYDTSAGAASAAAKAVADGNRLILGPLQAADITAVAATARTSRIPVISLASDEAFAARDVFVMGSMPSQSIGRTVAYARQQGMSRFSALIPAGDYGQRASSAFTSAVRAAGGTLVGFETFDRSNTSIGSAAQRLRQKGQSDVVLVADGVRLAALAAPAFRPTATAPSPRLIGTELWSGESALGTTPALRGAWYAAVSDTRFRQFADSYRTRFGSLPFRVATLGYDSVLLTLRIARDWRPGTAFPAARLLDRGGFLGLDGPFRFNANGVVERALEVREVRAGGVNVVSPAPARFDD